MASIAIIGELNLDLIVLGAERFPNPGEELVVDQMVFTLGASSAIIACQLARLGNEVQFFSRVGKDDLGRSALEFLRQKGVPVEFVVIDETRATGLTISVALGGERAMMTVMGCIDDIQYEQIDFAKLQGCQHLHLSSFFLQRGLRPEVWRLFQQAKAMGMTTSLDTGYPDNAAAISDLTKVWEQLDVFLPNEVEATMLSGQSEVSQALDWLSARVPTVALKLGAEGAMARRDGQTVSRPSFPVKVVETTGAGDSFNGGFLHGWLAGGSLADCLELGNACGALSTRAPGGTTTQGTMAEVTELIRASMRDKPDKETE